MIMYSGNGSILITFIKNATVVNVGFLGCAPVTEDFVQGKELDFCKVSCIFFERRRVS